MYDVIYKSEDVDTEFQPIFQQLCTEFAGKYEIWRRVENFGRWLSAGVLNPSTQVAAIISLQKGNQRRTKLLSLQEIQRIREHLGSDAHEDLAL